MIDLSRHPKRLDRKIRCAIYTRKSSEEGLEQSFNSLDAQREACAAFILSQKHEGWTVVPTRYDDGGYSGGTIERPALRRLIDDIEAGHVDVVVVYKVDRLTRALSDFSKLVDIFDRFEVSFVSITQQFNTTTSMGRLTLNILLSFAQFEREVIGERVRDKIAASKRKGMWMGGMPPLGYDVRDRELVVNAEEARVVVDIFRRYLALKSVHALRDELAAGGITSKRRTRHDDGEPYGGRPFSRGALYLILRNRLYRGEIVHKGNIYPGRHPAIVDPTLWDEVQATLAANGVDRDARSVAGRASLLTGLVFDEAGERLTPTHTVKKGTRYRYYVSASLVRGERTQSSGWRIPAGDLERVVIDRIRAYLADRNALIDTFDGEDRRIADRLEGARRLADAFRTETSDRLAATLQTVIRRIEVKTERVDVVISRASLDALVADPTTVRVTVRRTPDDDDDLSTLTTPVQLKRAGREMRLVVADDPASPPDPGLLRVVARAHDMAARLVQDPDLTVHAIAQSEGVSSAYVYCLLRLAWLAPDITAAIVDGRHPPRLTAKTLMRSTGRLPVEWTAQRRVLGFPPATDRR